MYQTGIIEKFVELRAQGWSLNHIASDLQVAKRTLVEWNREQAAQIKALRALEQEIAQDKFAASRAEERARLLQTQKDVEDELASRTLRFVDTDKLFRIAAALREEIRDLRMETDSTEESTPTPVNRQPHGVVPATNGTI